MFIVELMENTNIQKEENKNQTHTVITWRQTFLLYRQYTVIL